MKKILPFFLFLLIPIYCSNAQNVFELDVTVSTAVNDYFGDANVGLGANLSYLIPVSELVHFGPSAGFTLFLVNGSDNYGLVPITASGRVQISQRFFAGVDLGYSFLIVDDIHGGFYYRPKIGYDFKAWSLLASYTGTTQDYGTLSFMGLGVEFGL
ncbi:MAG TPA: hypothetical protein ENH91_05400 [Leeuwenhoekiella sp.]|nr:hypothetical protein [Leeuwenhoekiella sp.]